MSNEKPSEAEMNEARFLALVQMLASGAMQAMGKTAMPGAEDEEPEVHLDQARFMIDMLEALQKKTKGNLSDREGRMLESHLTSLRLTFVDEVNRQQKGGGPKPAPPESKPDSGERSAREKPGGFVDKRSSGTDE